MAAALSDDVISGAVKHVRSETGYFDPQDIYTTTGSETFPDMIDVTSIINFYITNK